jgi:hypothetical protein
MSAISNNGTQGRKSPWHFFLPMSSIIFCSQEKRENMNFNLISCSLNWHHNSANVWHVSVAAGQERSAVMICVIVAQLTCMCESWQQGIVFFLSADSCKLWTSKLFVPQLGLKQWTLQECSNLLQKMCVWKLCSSWTNAEMLLPWHYCIAIMYLSHDKKQVDSSFLFPHGLCELFCLQKTRKCWWYFYNVHLLLVAFSSSPISMKLLDWIQEQATQSLLFTPQFICTLWWWKRKHPRCFRTAQTPCVHLSGKADML